MEVEILLDRFSKKGKPSGLYGTAQVEVAGAVPGDQVRVELSRKRKGWHKGFLKEVVKASPFRIVPRCKHASLCGGCTWQAMDYQEQLRLKEEVIQKIFPDSHSCLRPIVPCDDPWQYRNKMEFSFSQNRLGERFLGLIQTTGKGRVFNLTECHLTSPWFAKTLNAVRAWWEKTSLRAYHMNDEGSLRTLTLREGKRTGDKLVMLTVSGNPLFALTQEQMNRFIEAVQSIVQEVSIFLQIQQVAKGKPTQFYEILLKGPDHIKEQLEINTGNNQRTLTFKISPTSFFQPNPKQAEKLYSLALQMVTLPPHACVFDLYAGTATLGMALSLQAERVVSIELNPHAIFDAQASAKMNQIHNLSLHCGDVGKIISLLREAEDFRPPDLAIVDPPRAGLDQKALEHLLALAPSQILYISCNPYTQGQNIQVLQEGGYRIEILQPLDQFPHTPHIENIVLLKK